MNAPKIPAAVIQPALNRMPDPTGNHETTELEQELAARFGARHAVAVSSGTAAVYTALTAAGIGVGDEVLLPAATVVMTVASVVHSGARPIFVDSQPGRLAMDLDDAAAKLSPRTRAIMPVHLFGRIASLPQAADFARDYNLFLIEDACQAQGSVYKSRAAGTWGNVGCFSMKDGKLLACGEGGYLLTDDTELAKHAASFRNHGLTPAPGVNPGERLGHNYRLAEPLAAIARHQLTRFDSALALRRRQHDYLLDRLDGTPGLIPIIAEHGSNGYSPLWQVLLTDPRGFSTRLAELGIANSVGTFALKAAPKQASCRILKAAPCPHATAAVDQLLALVLTAHHTEHELDRMAATIRREADSWR